MKKAIRFEDILTMEQVADKMELTLDTVNGWRKKGMPVIKIDKYVRVYWPDLLEWIVEQKEETESSSGQASLFTKKKAQG